jgi:hypothetical protein
MARARELAQAAVDAIGTGADSLGPPSVEAETYALASIAFGIVELTAAVDKLTAEIRQARYG